MVWGTAPLTQYPAVCEQLASLCRALRGSQGSGGVSAVLGHGAVPGPGERPWGPLGTGHGGEMQERTPVVRGIHLGELRSRAWLQPR